MGDCLSCTLRISLGRTRRLWRTRESKKEVAGPSSECQKCFLPFNIITSFTHLMSHSASHLHIKSCGLSLVIFNTHATRSAIQSKTSVVSSLCHVDTKLPLQTSAKIYSPYTYQDWVSAPRTSSPEVTEWLYVFFRLRATTSVVTHVCI